jgi:hypothetical protein
MIIVFDFNKLILKNIIVLIPKYKENMLSYLAPVIGIYGIKINLFIEEFEKKTDIYDIDIIIPVKIIIYKINTFDLIIKIPYINFFLNEIYNNINILYLYKLSFLKSLLNFNYIINNYKMIRSYIKSLQLLKNKFLFFKYNFYVLNKINFYKYIKNLIINYNFIKNYIKYNYGFYIIINNINSYNFFLSNINLKFFKLKYKFNYFFLGINIFNLNIFYLIEKLYFKNKLKLLNIKYFNNKLQLNFFKFNFILKKTTIFNFLNILYYISLNLFLKYNYIFNNIILVKCLNFKNA